MTLDQQNQRQRERNKIVPAFWISTSFVGENDALVNFFAQESGATTAKAKGLKKATSKLAPHLQTADELIVSFTQGRGANPVLTGIKLHKGHLVWRNNLNHSALAWLMGECAVMASTEEEENQKVYQLIVNLFRSEPESAELCSCAASFCLKFLHLHGWLGSLGHCAVSGDPLAKAEPVYFLLSGEGIVGRSGYKQSHTGRGANLVRLAPQRLERWRHLLNGPLLDYKQVTADNADVALLLHLTHTTLGEATGRRVGSAKFLVKQWGLPNLHELAGLEIV